MAEAEAAAAAAAVAVAADDNVVDMLLLRLLWMSHWRQVYHAAIVVAVDVGDKHGHFRILGNWVSDCCLYRHFRSSIHRHWRTWWLQSPSSLKRMSQLHCRYIEL